MVLHTFVTWQTAKLRATSCQTEFCLHRWASCWAKTYLVRVTTYAETWPRSSPPSSTRAPETDISQPRFEPPTSCTAGGHSSKELFEQLMNCHLELQHMPIFAAIRNPYSFENAFRNIQYSWRSCHCPINTGIPIFLSTETYSAHSLITRINRNYRYLWNSKIFNFVWEPVSIGFAMVEKTAHIEMEPYNTSTLNNCIYLHHIHQQVIFMRTLELLFKMYKKAIY